MRLAARYAAPLLQAFLCGGILAATGCSSHAGPAAGQAPALATRVPLATIADSLFWRTLHAGAYDSIPRAMLLLKAAYLQNPSDAVTASHVAFLHAWRIAERARVAQQNPGVTDDAVLARYYFGRSAAHAGRYDARIHGFGAVFQMAEGDIHRDTTLWAEGLRQGRDAIRAWPEFNLFTVGYALSTQPDSSALFREGLNMQWKTIDACGRTVVDRANPTPEAVLSSLRTDTDPLRRRACTNSWIAPHNMQGFFLNMGDMVVKSGDWRRAQKVYMLAKAADGYDSWPYRELLESRLRDAEQNVAAFRKENGPVMFRSKVSCSACHQSGGSEVRSER